MIAFRGAEMLAGTGEIIAGKHVLTDRVSHVLGKVGHLDAVLRTVLEGLNDNVVMDGSLCDGRGGVDPAVVLVLGGNESEIFEAIVVNDG